jgi:hypothetical protein
VQGGLLFRKKLNGHAAEARWCLVSSVEHLDKIEVLMRNRAYVTPDSHSQLRGTGLSIAAYETGNFGRSLKFLPGFCHIWLLGSFAVEDGDS